MACKLLKHASSESRCTSLTTPLANRFSSLARSSIDISMGFMEFLPAHRLSIPTRHDSGWEIVIGLSPSDLLDVVCRGNKMSPITKLSHEKSSTSIGRHKIESVCLSD